MSSRIQQWVCSAGKGLAILIASFLICAPLRAEEYQISTIAIDGNQRVDTAAIKRQLKKQSGLITSEDIRTDVKTLYKTGFFEQVTAKIMPISGPTQQDVLHYIVIEKPVVRKVFIKGNKEISEKDLTEIFTFDARRFFDVGNVRALIRQAVSKYQSKGYHDASIDYTVLPVGENQVDLTFNVKEGERYSISEIRITGLATVDEGDLLAVIQTKRYKWWNSWLFGTGRLNQDMLENDRAIMRQYLLDHGLVDASISEPSVTTEDHTFVVTFAVNEGPVYTLGKVSASGDLLNGSESETIKDIKSKPGETFDATALREDAFKISEEFGDQGYAFVNVVPNTYIDRSANKVNVDFATNKGNVVKINRINIKGNVKTYDHVIRRELKVDEQEIYSGKRVRRSQELLQRLGYFDEVNITQQPVGKDKVDLDVNVKEGSTGSFSAGAGYSTSDGVIFNARISENNLLGTGRRIVLSLDQGTQRDSYVLSLEDRRLFDSYVSGATDLYRSDRAYKDFNSRLTGAAVTVGYPLDEIFGEWAEDFAAAVKYEYMNIQINDVDPTSAALLVVASQGSSTASSITPRLVRNTINNPLNPSRGSRQELSVELAGLGGDQDFYLIEGHNTWYTPVFGDDETGLVFSWRTTLGYGESNTDQPFPLYRRYFPGGINSVRGFRARTLGPKDPSGHEYGGSKELVNNLEFIFPLVRSAGLKFVTFYDVGQAYDDNQSMDLSQLRKAYGGGIRWNSPIGPIRLEFGFPLSREDGEDAMVTMFSFGAPL